MYRLSIFWSLYCYTWKFKSPKRQFCPILHCLAIVFLITLLPTIEPVTVEKCWNIAIQAHSGVVLNGNLWRLKYQYLNPCSCTEYEYTNIEFECRVAAAVSSAQPGGKYARSHFVRKSMQLSTTRWIGCNHLLQWKNTKKTMTKTKGKTNTNTKGKTKTNVCNCQPPDELAAITMEEN